MTRKEQVVAGRPGSGVGTPETTPAERENRRREAEQEAGRLAAAAEHKATAERPAEVHHTNGLRL